MSRVTDPPSVERKRAKSWKRVRGIGRKLVNKRTLMMAFQIVIWTTRIALLLKHLFGGF